MIELNNLVQNRLEPYWTCIKIKWDKVFSNSVVEINTPNFIYIKVGTTYKELYINIEYIVIILSLSLI